jgi:hypothetical protein
VLQSLAQSLFLERPPGHGIEQVINARSECRKVEDPRGGGPSADPFLLLLELVAAEETAETR